MTTWYYETDMGCALEDIPACSEERARMVLVRKTGTDNPPRELRPATDEDIVWVHWMGGYVPPQAKTRLASM